MFVDPPGAMQIELEPWYAHAREETPLPPTTLHPRLVDASLKVARLVGDAFLQLSWSRRPLSSRTPWSSLEVAWVISPIFDPRTGCT